MISWKNSSKDITMEQCLQCQAFGMNVIVNDGKDITFEMEFNDYDN